MQVIVSSKQPDLSSFEGSVYSGVDFTDLADQKNVILTPSDMNEWPYSRLRPLALDDNLLMFQNSLIRAVHLDKIYIVADQSYIDALLADPDYVPLDTLQMN